MQTDPFPVGLLHGLPTMSTGRPPRLPSFSYVGMHRYFVTVCTRDRTPVFVRNDVVQPMIGLLERSSREWAFSLPALRVVDVFAGALGGILGGTCWSGLKTGPYVLLRSGAGRKAPVGRRVGRREWPSGLKTRRYTCDEDATLTRARLPGYARRWRWSNIPARQEF